MTDENLSEDVAELKARVRRLERLVEQDDENHTGQSATAHAANTDRYDRRVLDGIESGEVVTLKKFRTLYNAAGVKDGEKVKTRIQALTSRDEFEKDKGMGRWRYSGGGAE